jgi:hypothetical protein
MLRPTRPLLLRRPTLHPPTPSPPRLTRSSQRAGLARLHRLTYAGRGPLAWARLVLRSWDTRWVRLSWLCGLQRTPRLGLARLWCTVLRARLGWHAVLRSTLRLLGAPHGWPVGRSGVLRTRLLLSLPLPRLLLTRMPRPRPRPLLARLLRAGLYGARL